MIVPMQKVYVAVRAAQKDRLLSELGRLGVVHLAPVDPASARPDEKLSAAIGRLRRAEQILANVEPAGAAPEMAPQAVADRVLDLVARAADLSARLTGLYRQAEGLTPWGDTRLTAIQDLRGAGVHVRIFSVQPEDMPGVTGDVVELVGQLGKRVLVAVAARDSQAITAPETAKELPLPPRDRPAVLEEAHHIDQQRRADADELARLASRTADLAEYRRGLEEQARFETADHSGLAGEALFGIQGWMPAGQADGLSAGLARADLEAGLEFLEPGPDEQPPTLVRYPRWARPIKGLFDMLGTTPGYREADVSGFFMIALPIFAAMLIGDAGYGLLMLLGTLLFYRRLTAKAGRPQTQLILIFSIVTVIWGVLTATYFGVSPGAIASAGGYESAEAMLAAPAEGWAAVGHAMAGAGKLYRTDAQAARNIVIMISFILGAAHLVAAQLRQAIGVLPDLRGLANVGWAVFLTGMLDVVWGLFFPQPLMPSIMRAGLLLTGGTLVVLFTYPSRNPVKRLGVGLLSNVLPMIGTFSDLLSYIRLMAVGMASYYIAASFNQLAAQVANGSSWLLAWPILLLGHGLNLGLAAIAVFAHGVRLNMLEFSNNAGVQWSGYAYAPFTVSDR